MGKYFLMEKIKNIITLFEWTYENKPRLFALGIIIGASISYVVNQSINDANDYNIKQLREENERLRQDIGKAQKECLEKIKEVKEFLKYIAE